MRRKCMNNHFSKSVEWNNTVSAIKEKMNDERQTL